MITHQELLQAYTEAKISQLERDSCFDRFFMSLRYDVKQYAIKHGLLLPEIEWGLYIDEAEGEKC